MPPKRSKSSTGGTPTKKGRRRRVRVASSSEDDNDGGFEDPSDQDFFAPPVSESDNNAFESAERTVDLGLGMSKNDIIQMTPSTVEASSTEDSFVTPSVPGKEGMYNPTSYYFGWNEHWTPEWQYRLPGDVALRAIRETGSEGTGRIEVGWRLGMDTGAKAGNRRVSAHIVTVCKEHPSHIGQYQKMEGKIRCIKYFWKQQSQPESFQKLFDDFERLSGRVCPFKMGQTLKFPETGLSTLRISDVSLRRLNDILEMLKTEPVLVTIHKIMKTIHSKELSQGYQFQIDKKSLMKCLLALQKAGFLTVFETLVVSDLVENKIQIVAQPHIRNADCPEVAEAIQRAIDQYHAEGRVFPHGQLRYSLKKKAELEKVAEAEQEQENVEEQLREAETLLQSGFADGVSLVQRYSLFRLQSSKSIVTSTNGHEKDKAGDILNNGNPLASNEDDQMGDGKFDTAIDSLDDTMNSNPDDDGGNIETIPELDEQEDLEKENDEIADGGEDKRPALTLASTGVLSDGIDDPLTLTSIPTTLGHLVRKKDLYDPHTDFGYQSKMIRACALHDVVWNFVYGSPEAKPTVYERYAPGRDPCTLPEIPISDLPVYVDDESPYRFMPPCPSFANLPQGWFMLQDLFCSLPLSTFVLIGHISKSVPKDMLSEFLRDPIRRHVPLGDLPMILRKPIFQDKKSMRQVEHCLLMLCAMGLSCLAPNPDAKRFTTPHTSVFFVSKKGMLYDTSTSERGYARISLPIEKYPRYVYSFDSRRDVALYWHHLRAISQSTPLNFRMDQNTSEINPLRHKRYSIGMFEKKTVTIEGDLTEEVGLLTPSPPADGCGGFDSAMFMHLKRHWDLNPRPSNVVSWFIFWFRRNGEMAKPEIECRVENLQKDWNSFVRSLMPSDMELTRKKRVKASAELLPTNVALQTLHMEPKHRIPSAPKGHRHKKRPLDSVDLISQQNRLHLRCRFNARERDMLILIRAVGFFLNPVYRFWLDPSVVRDIMHEYVPESRTKTVQSLMAAGVREMVRPQRLAYLQRIVRNLSTFKEMRDLRFQLAGSPLTQPDAKISFFKNAFNTANRLLFMESQNIPSTSANDATFEMFLASGQALVSAEQCRMSAPMPLRSQKPTSLNHIHHCVATNVLLSVLLGYAKESDDDQKAEEVLEQLNASDINSTLQVLRSDGLVSRSRALDPLMTRNHATLSYYFRHFFGHRFHPELVEQVITVIRLLDELDGTATVSELGPYEDYAGAVVMAADGFVNKADTDFEVDDSIIQMFAVEMEDQNKKATKQIRYLENADLQLEKIKIFLGAPDVEEDLIEVDELLQMLDTSIPEDALPARPLEDWLAELDVPAKEKALLRQVAMAVQATDAFGASIPELRTATNLAESEVDRIVGILLKHYQVVEAGVDTRRMVWHAYADAWTVVVGGRRVQGRPWLQPTGGVCASTVRWMCESILMSVVNKPGIQMRDLRFRYEFALQPAAVEQLVKVIVRSGCVDLRTADFESMTFSNPFEESPAKATVQYLVPTVQAIQRFARIFQEIPTLSIITSGPNGNLSSSKAATIDKSSDKKLIPLISAGATSDLVI